MKRLALCGLIVLAWAVAGTAIAQSAIKILGVHDKLEIVAEAAEAGNTQQSGQTLSPRLERAPGNDVTLRATISNSNIPGFEIKSGARLVFTPSNYNVAQKIELLFSKKVTAGQKATLTLSGSGIETKTISVAAVNPGSAASNTGDPNAGVINFSTLPGAQTNLETVFTRTIRIVFWLIALLAFLGLLYAGFQYITAGGDAAKTTIARRNIIYSLIGIVVALASYVVLAYVVEIAGG